MNYIEWLRVRNCLRTLVIVLAIFVALAGVLRLSLARYMSTQAILHHIAQEPGMQVQRLTLPDGTKRTIFDDPASRTHAVVDDRGSGGTHAVIVEPAGEERTTDSVNVGGFAINKTEHNGMITTTIETTRTVGMIYYMALAALVGLIVATVLAAPLAREIDGHLELALTKPVARIRYGAGAIGADVAGIVGAVILTAIAGYLCEAMFGRYFIDFSGVNSRAMLMGVAAPAAWYALLCAATTWSGRSFGAVLGFAWPVAIAITVLVHVPAETLVGIVVHDAAWGLSRIDPLTYVSFSGEVSATAYSGANFAMRLGIEILLFVVYAALALVRWERAEA